MSIPHTDPSSSHVKLRQDSPWRSGAARVALRFSPPLAVFGIALGVWFSLSYIFLAPDQRFLLPPPQQVIMVGFLDWANLSEVLGALLQTTRVVFVGLSVAMLLGTTFAIIMSQARW